MGTDIDGWIECKQVSEAWTPAVALGAVYLGRDYQAFGKLFGVRNIANIQPIAAKRGLPEDVSQQVKKDAMYSGLYAHSWIAWQELKENNWGVDRYWEAMVKVLEILADLHGDENIRLVVWFED
jgi:hypothetical protein